ncbi:MAG: argininosuccinate lyase, partial [Pseudomonadota bacterium]
GYGAFSTAFRAALGRETSLDAAAFEDAVSAETFVRRRSRPGGPAPSALAEAQVLYRTALEDLKQTADARRRRHSDAADDLDTAFAKLMEA